MLSICPFIYLHTRLFTDNIFHNCIHQLLIQTGRTHYFIKQPCLVQLVSQWDQNFTAWSGTLLWTEQETNLVVLEIFVHKIVDNRCYLELKKRGEYHAHCHQHLYPNSWCYLHFQKLSILLVERPVSLSPSI